MNDLLVKLQIYEGPLDLLLHLIKKNEVDLDDIPVALITAQYLDYLDLMESMNVEVAADFLVMAATLTQIKSRLLLPREDDGDLETDPAGELKAAIIDPLLARLRQGGDYREVAEILGRRRMLNTDVFVRGGRPLLELAVAEAETAPPGEGLIEASLFDLMDAFRRLAERKNEAPVMRFVVETKTIGQRIEEIQAFLRERNGTFAEICASDRDQGELVLSFLTVLELARVGFLKMYQNLSQSMEILVFLANAGAELEASAELDY